MSWYRAGTINLTNGSVEVVGAGTAFSSEVRFSDILLVGGSLYEIARVESDTKLKLSTPFQGITAEESAYAVIRNLTNASNFELMKKIEAFLTDRQRSMDEFVEWINGLPDTGPTSNGVFPLTDRYGVTVFCKSPKQLEADTLALTTRQFDLISETETALTSAQSKLTAIGNQEAWADQILGYKNAAAASATKAGQWAENAENAPVETGKYSAKHHAIKASASATASASSASAAATSKTGADSAKTAAETAKTAAQLAEANAAGSATAAKTSETNAAGSASAAANSASQAANSKTGADTAKTQAETARTGAQTSETNAATSAANAATSASSANSSSNSAKDWAEKTTGAVTGTQYSAKHHAQLAQNARADVETRQVDVTARQTDVRAIQTDVTTRQSNVVNLEASALASKNAAATSATTASTKAADAATSATAASTSASGASASELKANKWAEEAENAPVETGKYSAKHHALKAAASATSAGTSATAAGTAKTAAETAKTAAETAKTAAETAKTAAQTAESGAVSAKVAAEEARDRAELAASTLTGNLVEFGGVDLSGGAYPITPATAGFWKVTAGGLVDSIEYGVGDTLVYSRNLAQFYKIDNTESVTAVNGKTGVVLLNAADVGALAAAGTAVAATKLATARTISTSGDATGSVSFDGTANAAITLTLVNSGVVAGTYPKVTVDAKGRVTAGTSLSAADIPTLNQSTTGNAATATKLATARTINGVAFDGTANITVNDSTKLPTSGGTLTGPVTRAYENASAGLMHYQDLAHITSNSSSVTGTLKITLPYGWTNTMMTLRIQGYCYNSLGHWELTLGGYNYDHATSPGWVNCSASSNGTSLPFSSVRLGHDGTKACILLGVTTSTWQYPKVALTEMLAGYSGANLNWGAGWSMAFITDETGITVFNAPKINAGANALLLDGQSSSYYLSASNLNAGILPDARLSGTYTGVSITGNAASATKLQTARAINGVAFDGSADITVVDRTRLPLDGSTAMTGALTLPSPGTSWIVGTGGTGSAIRYPVASTANWHAWASQKTANGNAWAAGVLGDSFYLSFATKANIDAGTNSTSQIMTATSSGVSFAGTINGNGAGLTSLDASNLASGILPDARLSGTYTGVSITGNAATATRAGTLNWANYGGGQGVGNGSHVIFDASNGLSPSGAAISNTNPSAPWSATYPTLMGWNGTGTYGVRVDRARYADEANTGFKVIANTAGSSYADGQLELRNSDGGHVSLGFHRGGYTACQLRHSGGGLILSGTSQTTAADLYVYGNVTAYSDERLKSDIEPIVDALTKVEQLNGVTFAKTNEEEGRRHAGVIAQDVLAVLPEVVHLGDDGYYSVAYGNMVGLLIEAIKELNNKVDSLQAEVIELRRAA